MKKEKKFDFIREERDIVKLKLKERKQWLKLLEHEMTLARTYKNNQQEHVMNMILVARSMIKHYQTMLDAYDEMLDEVTKIEKE